jgi:Mrp family chromosome partitioning ATPase
MLAITSTKQGEGKTLTSLNLGISISRDRNYDVIVVDTDLRSPSICEYLGIRPEKGLSDYLEGNATLNEILVSPGRGGRLI